ncbi:ABC transporter permease [Paenibacillus oryzisoli]|nr:ABC transporter permease subunit [Paenibacillus oryzisoli]
MAFQEYVPGKSFLHQKWVGLEQFKRIFTDELFYQVLRNTLAMSAINITFSFITAIGLAILLNEVRVTWFKRTVQTISYLPYFISWVVAANIIMVMLSSDNGIVNILLLKLGVIDSSQMWLGKPDLFWWIIGIANVWKNVGWNAIIYLAAISAIEPHLYESADIDGANRLQKIRHITLPGIKPTIVILLIMSIGHVMQAGFEQQYLLGNSLVKDKSMVFDIFVLEYGIRLSRYSFAAAAGIFNSVVSIAMLLMANYIAGKMGEERII